MANLNPVYLNAVYIRRYRYRNRRKRSTWDCAVKKIKMAKYIHVLSSLGLPTEMHPYHIHWTLRILIAHSYVILHLIVDDVMSLSTYKQIQYELLTS